MRTAAPFTRITMLLCCVVTAAVIGCTKSNGAVAPEEVAYLPAGKTLSCAPGEKMTGIEPLTGNVVCAPDTVTNDAYKTQLLALEEALAELAKANTAAGDRLDILEAGLCPRGFTYATDAAGPEGMILCTRTGFGGTDEVVRVGDFWTDRFEASLCPESGGLGGRNGADTSGAACSTAGVEPQAQVTWFQALALCTNAGKRLCTNAEWQAAALGTPDDGSCNTLSSLWLTGEGGSCVSRYGAESMVGNLWEWAADWFAAPPRPEDPLPYISTTWNEEFFGGDIIGNVASMAREDGPWMQLPAAAVRGGAVGSGGMEAGPYAFALDNAPSNSNGVTGFRCCKSGP